MRAFFVLFGILCVSCSSVSQSFLKEPEPKFPQNVISIAWHKPISIKMESSGETYERTYIELDPQRNRLFVGSSDHGMYSVRASSGEILWRFETLGPVQSDPLYDPKEDALYFGSNDGALYKVNAKDGTLFWRFSTKAEINRKPIIVDETIFVANANDTLIALSTFSGEMIWNQHRTPASGMEIAGYAGPAVYQDKIYFAYSDGTVAAYLRSNGKDAWPTVDLAAEAEQMTGEVPRFLDVDTTPIVAELESGPVVFVASYAGGIFALDAQNGRRVWVNEKTFGVTDLIWNNSNPKHPTLIASSGSLGIAAIHPISGKTIWRHALPEGGMTAATSIRNTLLVGTTRYGLFLFSQDGTWMDGLSLGSGIATPPVQMGSWAFVMNNNGELFGLNVE